MSEQEQEIEKLIDQCCDEFESQLRSGHADPVQMVQRLPEEHRGRLLRELILLEAELRPLNEFQQRQSRYLQLFPTLAADIEEAFGEFQKSTVDAHRARDTSQRFHESSSALPQISNYKLLEPIGKGGMGIVYQAQQIQPVKRLVALKIIKAGFIRDEVIARFEAEQQALAMMEHPGIAKILDAGTTQDGSPFYVMELIKGLPLTDYCDAKRLTITERLELFAQVCDAVEHAHLKGIIHRDLKPSNILIAEYNARPQAKVIDFGLAKTLDPSVKLTDRTMFTEFGQVMGTLKYMSPEQANLDSLDIDIRSDIYSLGAILHELLTGKTPIDEESLKGVAFLKILEAIRDAPTPRPSYRLSTTKAEQLKAITQKRKTTAQKLITSMVSELDWIVLKALEVDRFRRYQSVDRLKSDIRCFLVGDAVSAKPPSLSYRVSKFVRRHLALVASITLILLSLLLGLSGMTWQAFQLVKARDGAEKAEARAIDKAEQLEIALNESEALRFVGESRLLKDDPQASIKAALGAHEKAGHAVPEVWAGLVGAATRGSGEFFDATNLHGSLLVQMPETQDILVVSAETAVRLESEPRSFFPVDAREAWFTLRRTIDPLESRDLPGSLFEFDSEKLGLNERPCFAAQVSLSKRWTIVCQQFDVVLTELDEARELVRRISLLPVGKGRWEGIPVVAAFDLEEKWVAVADDSGAAWVWDLKSGGIEASGLELAQASAGITQLMFAGESLITGDSSGTVRVFQRSELGWSTPITHQIDGIPSALAFDNAATIAVGSTKGELTGYRAGSGEFVFRVSEAHQSWISDLVYSPNESSWISASHDRSIAMWGMGGESIQLWHRIRAFASGVEDLLLDPKTQDLFAVDQTGDVRRWKAGRMTEDLLPRLHYNESPRLRGITRCNGGNQFVAINADSGVTIGSLARRDRRDLTSGEMGGPVMHLTSAGQCDSFATADQDGVIRFWEILDDGIRQRAEQYRFGQPSLIERIWMHPAEPIVFVMRGQRQTSELSAIRFDENGGTRLLDYPIELDRSPDDLRFSGDGCWIIAKPSKTNINSRQPIVIRCETSFEKVGHPIAEMVSPTTEMIQFVADPDWVLVVNDGEVSLVSLSTKSSANSIETASDLEIQAVMNSEELTFFQLRIKRDDPSKLQLFGFDGTRLMRREFEVDPNLDFQPISSKSGDFYAYDSDQQTIRVRRIDRNRFKLVEAIIPLSDRPRRLIGSGLHPRLLVHDQSGSVTILDLDQETICSVLRKWLAKDSEPRRDRSLN